MAEETARKKYLESDDAGPIALLTGLVAVLVAAYWNSFTELWKIWGQESGKYSHGYLIPVFSLFLLYLRYQPLRFRDVTPSARWTGVGLLLAGLAMRVAMTHWPHKTPEMYSFIPCVMGLFVMVGGWPTLRWAGPAVGFLIFMYPLPAQLDSGLLAPLQSVATAASTYCLQTLGISSYHEGNAIWVDDIRLGVEEQCSGLRMLNIFIALSVALTLIVELPIWQRVVILLSSAPIALAVNIARITITGVLFMFSGMGYLEIETVKKIFHDMAGWFMMPMALGLLYLVMQVLAHLFVEEDTAPMPMGMPMRPPGAPI